MPLLGDVDGDADQLDLRRFRVDHLRPCAHPHPLSVGVAHPEHLVDVVDLACDDPVGELEQVAVLGMDDPVDLAERQHRVAGLIAQHVVHRTRPVHLAAHHVPVPQAAAAAHQRHVDALVRFEIDAVGGLGARRLAEIGIEDDDQHAGRQHEQRDVERNGFAPRVEDRILRNERCGSTIPVICQAHRGIPVLAADADLHHPGAVAEHEQRLTALGDGVERPPFPARRLRCHGNDFERAVGDRKHVASTHCALTADALQQVLRRARRRSHARINANRTGQLARREREDRLGVAFHVIALVHQRQEPQRRDDKQENDD